MKLLAVDTALGACSVAVIDNHSVLAHCWVEMARGHAEALAPMVHRAMADAGLEFAQLDRLAVTTGPGTFTGQRVGLAFMRGLRVALGCPLVGVTTLEAMAAAAAAESGAHLVAVLHEAKRGEVYAALYRRGDVVLPVQIAPFDAMMSAIGTAASDELLALAGTGKTAAALWCAAHGLVCTETTILQPDARWVGRLACNAPVTSAPVRPLYLRSADVKLPGSTTRAVAVCRRASVPDASLLAGLHKECLSPSWSAEDFAKALAQPECIGLVAEDQGRLVALALARSIAGEAELLTLGVATAWRRKGLGRRLLQEVAAASAAMGATKLYLEVASGNAPARRLYEGQGFLAVGLRKGYYSDGDDALVLRAVLPFPHMGIADEVA